MGVIINKCVCKHIFPTLLFTELCAVPIDCSRQDFLMANSLQNSWITLIWLVSGSYHMLSPNSKCVVFSQHIIYYCAQKRQLTWVWKIYWSLFWQISTWQLMTTVWSTESSGHRNTKIYVWLSKHLYSSRFLFLKKGDFILPTFWNRCKRALIVI